MGPAENLMRNRSYLVEIIVLGLLSILCSSGGLPFWVRRLLG